MLRSDHIGTICDRKGITIRSVTFKHPSTFSWRRFASRTRFQGPGELQSASTPERRLSGGRLLSRRRHGPSWTFGSWRSVESRLWRQPSVPADTVEPMIEQIREVLRFENPFVQVFEDDVRFANGSLGRYLRIGPPPSRGPGAVIVPICGPLVGLVQTYRYPVEGLQWGFPRGFGDATDESPLETAARELKEEIGDHEVAKLQLLGWVTPDSGMLSTRAAVVAATIPQRRLESRPLDDDEILSVRWIEAETLWREIGSGQIEDGFTLAALSLCLAHRLLGVR